MPQEENIAIGEVLVAMIKEEAGDSWFEPCKSYGEGVTFVWALCTDWRIGQRVLLKSVNLPTRKGWGFLAHFL